MTKKSCLIVGKGFAACSIALKLLEQGRSVTLVGPKQDNSMGSQAALGLIGVKGHHTARSELFSFKLASHKFFKTWLKNFEIQSGQSIPSFLGVYETFQDNAHKQRVIDRTFGGVLDEDFSVQTKSNEYIQERYDAAHVKPSVSLSGAFFYPGDYWVDAQVLLKALHTYFENHKDVSVVDDLISNVTATSPTLFSVSTSQGRVFEPEDIFFAAGAGTSSLLKKLGMDIEESLHPGVILKKKFVDLDENSRPIKPSCFLLGKQKFISSFDAWLFGAENFSSSPPPFDQSEDGFLKSKLKLETAFRNYVDFPTQFSDEDFLQGVRVRTPKMLPLVGWFFEPQFQKKFFVMTGLYKNGLQFAPFFSHRFLNGSF